MSELAFKYVFGPALSRRLGRSLGIDVVPFKTCTYDCVYCQLGPTTVHTLERVRLSGPCPVGQGVQLFLADFQMRILS